MSRGHNRARSHGRNKPQLVLQKPQKAPPEPIDLLEARTARTPVAKSARAFSLAWDQNEAMGLTADMRRSGPGMLSDQERKETLYKAYLNNVWISACVDVIAKRITSGGFVIEEVEQGKGNDANRQAIAKLLGFVNEDDEFLELVQSVVTDLLIYGEAYMEIVRKNGKPFSLHKIDCITMNYKLDQHGHVVQYIQNMTHNTDTITFEPEDVIRWWLPDPQAHQKALSPIERILGSVDADTRMADWVRQFFRKGAKPQFWIDFPGPQNEAERFTAYFRENFTGQANAHIPPVMYSGAKIMPFGQANIDADFLKGRDQMCKEILAGYQVPPAIVSLIETGNIGGGTGESQDKSFQFNACDPIKRRFFDKFNYRILKKGFGITDWVVNSRYADYRSDDVIARLQDLRIRNGSNLVNEVRRELGKQDIPGGDVAILVASREVIPVDRLAVMSDELAQNAEADLQAKQAQADMAQTRAAQAKNPQPAPVPGQPGQPGQPPQGKQQQAPPQRGKPAQESSGHTGAMVAFMLPREIGQQLALPGGEPVEDLHCTLAYLPNADQWTQDQRQRIYQTVSAFASSHPSMSGKLAGVGRFNAPPGEPEPVIALPDVPDLPAFRQALVKALSDAGFLPDRQHGYTPHLTLKYASPDEEMPIQQVPQLPLLFDRISLVIGDQRATFLLSGSRPEEAQKLTGLVSKQGSCQCATCKANAGKEVNKAPPYHAGCDCSLVAREDDGRPKAPQPLVAT